MERGAFLITLVLFTLLVALVVGFYQLYSVDRAKKEGSKSAITNRDGGNSTPT